MKSGEGSQMQFEDVFTVCHGPLSSPKFMTPFGEGAVTPENELLSPSWDNTRTNNNIAYLTPSKSKSKSRGDSATTRGSASSPVSGRSRVSRGARRGDPLLNLTNCAEIKACRQSRGGKAARKPSSFKAAAASPAGVSVTCSEGEICANVLQCVLFKKRMKDKNVKYFLYANGNKLTYLTSTTRIVEVHISDDASGGSTESDGGARGSSSSGVLLPTGARESVAPVDQVASNAFEIVNDFPTQSSSGVDCRYLLRAPPTSSCAGHFEWLAAIREAVADCVVAASLSASPIKIMDVNAALARAEHVLKVKPGSPVLKAGRSVYGFLVQVKELHDFVSKKDPGFHNGLMSGHYRIRELLNFAEEFNDDLGDRFPPLNDLVSYSSRLDSSENPAIVEDSDEDCEEGRDIQSTTDWPPLPSDFEKADELLRGTKDLKQQLVSLSMSFNDDEDISSEISSSEGTLPTRSGEDHKVWELECAHESPPAASLKHHHVEGGGGGGRGGGGGSFFISNWKKSAILALALFSVAVPMALVATFAYRLGEKCSESKRYYNVNDENGVWLERMVCETSGKEGALLSSEQVAMWGVDEDNRTWERSEEERRIEEGRREANKSWWKWKNFFRVKSNTRPRGLARLWRGLFSSAERKRNEARSA